VQIVWLQWIGDCGVMLWIKGFGPMNSGSM
jgi:hypothetical protein